jgi:hypothetical protein
MNKGDQQENPLKKLSYSMSMPETKSLESTKKKIDEEKINKKPCSRVAVLRCDAASLEMIILSRCMTTAAAVRPSVGQWIQHEPLRWSRLVEKSFLELNKSKSFCPDFPLLSGTPDVIGGRLSE